jgi:rhamnose transport system ATP-binding protein
VPYGYGPNHNWRKSIKVDCREWLADQTIGESIVQAVTGDTAVPFLRLINASKTFAGNTVLKNISLDIEAGEVHALMGENGAGKSTLIKILAGLHTPDPGSELWVAGKKVAYRTPADAIADGIATVHQELLLFPELSVAENIFIGHYPKRSSGAINWEEARRQARVILKELDAAELDVDTNVSRLSVAQRQRVEIARAMSLNAKILVLDEPTAALSEKDVLRLLDVVKGLKERGVGILYVSHRMSEIFQIADRLTVLRDGEFIGTHPIKDVDEGKIVSMMVGRSIDQLFPKVTPDIGEPVMEVSKLNCGPMVSDISFTLRRGEIFGISGLVGSGRSELAHALFGLTPAKSGTICIKGKQVRITSAAAARDLGMAYVPEDRSTQGLVRSMDVKQNISMAALKRITWGIYIRPDLERKRGAEAIKKLGVRAAEGPDQIVARLSGGNQQKVVVAKWLETQPDILILDEPTRGVDVGAKAEIHKLIGELTLSGLAILMISSELPEILGMSDRVMVINSGQNAGIFEREQLSPELLGEAMTRDMRLPTDASNNSGTPGALKGGQDEIKNNETGTV